MSPSMYSTWYNLLKINKFCLSDKIKLIYEQRSVENIILKFIKELTRLEIITLLCMEDRTHSNLTENMPDKNGNGVSDDFETVLSEVGTFREPQFEAGGVMQQGMYVPKPVVWETMYDPIYVLLRAVHRQDFQNSFDRFIA